MQLRNPLDRAVQTRDGFPILPGRFPVLGHLPAIMTDPLGLWRRAEREVGPFFWCELGFGRVQLQCLVPEAFNFFRNKHTSSASIRDAATELLGDSMIVRDGGAHQHQRTAMNVAFLPKGLSAAEVGPLFADIIAQRVDSWVARREIRALSETRELVLVLMFRMMGIDEAEVGEWRRHYENLMLLGMNIPFDAPGTPLRRGRASRAWLDARITRLVDDARRNPNASGLLAAIVRGRDDGGAAMSDPELRDNLRLLLLAGHETSATTMAWMAFMLAARQDVWRALVQEARDREIPRSPRELREFPYAEAVFRETLRLHPPVTNDGRRAEVDFEIAGRTIRKGTNLGVPVMYLSRLPSLYERPDEFMPERWLGKKESVSPVELVQFGGGPHFCLGYHLAWMEIVQFAVALAKACDARGVRPLVHGPAPRARFLPLMHPDPAARVSFGA